jgi:hypothetical protein
LRECLNGKQGNHDARREMSPFLVHFQYQCLRYLDSHARKGLAQSAYPKARATVLCGGRLKAKSRFLARCFRQHAYLGARNDNIFGVGWIHRRKERLSVESAKALRWESFAIERLHCLRMTMRGCTSIVPRTEAGVLRVLSAGY